MISIVLSLHASRIEKLLVYFYSSTRNRVVHMGGSTEILESDEMSYDQGHTTDK
jgi:hypothetical protein